MRDRRRVHLADLDEDTRRLNEASHRDACESSEGSFFHLKKPAGSSSSDVAWHWMASACHSLPDQPLVRWELVRQHSKVSAGGTVRAQRRGGGFGRGALQFRVAWVARVARVSEGLFKGCCSCLLLLLRPGPDASPTCVGRVTSGFAAQGRGGAQLAARRPARE